LVVVVWGWWGTELGAIYGYEPGWGLPGADDRRAISDLMAATAPRGGTAPPSPTAE
jgi:hypothetical protein